MSREAAQVLASVETATANSRVDVKKGHLLTDVLAALDHHDHPYCIMHGYSGFPNQIPSDVDLVSPNPRGILDIVRATRTARVVQILEHKHGACYVLLGGKDVLGPFLWLDVSRDYHRDGRVFLSGAEIIGNTRVWKGIKVPAPDIEFAYLLSNRLWKRALTEQHCLRLSEIYRESPEGCESRARALLPRRGADDLIEACRSGRWSQVQANLPKLLRCMLHNWDSAPRRSVVAYWASEIKRRLRRAVQPNGMSVVILGPDGTGKTSVAGEVGRVLAPAFRGTRRYHLRPRFGLEAADWGPVSNPHADPPRGPLLSCAKLAWWLADYYISYLVDTWPRLVRSSLVIFDRHYCDIVVDPRRYRYGGPRWLAEVLSQWALVGNPIVICLDADEDVILDRKREVTRSEVARQCEAYRQLAGRLPRSHLVDATRPLADVVAEVSGIVLDALEARTAARLGLGSRA